MKYLTWITTLVALPLALAGAEVPAGRLGPAAMGSYRQTVLVTFTSEAAARQARLRLAPLYHDLQAAFSTRMDDCDLNNLRVAEVMAAYGQKGTFYLNDPQNWFQSSPETGITAPAEPAVEVPRRLLARAAAGLAGGNSIGDHTLTHEMLPVLSKHRAFREIMEARVTIETHSVSPVISFVYPNVFYRSEFRDGTDRADLEEMLRRAGIYQLAEHRYNEDWDSGLQDSVFIICDNNTAGGRCSESVLTHTRGEEERPLFLVTMHALVRDWGGPAYPKLAAIYRKWSGRPDWWYCNNNEYAAYRYQVLHSRMTSFVEGRVVRAVLTRPDPLDLGDGTPLTLKVEGVSKDEVLSVESPGAEVQPVALAGAYGFDLFHDRRRGAVETYAKVDNPKNSDQLETVPAGPEGLRALLYRKDRVLTLVLRNEGRHSLEDVRVVFRLPLRWADGVIRRSVGALAPAAAVTLEVPLTERADPEHYVDGVEYDVAQVDFRGERRGRLYATCEAPGDEPAAFFAHDGFLALGPLAGDVTGFDPLTFAQPFLEGAPPQRTYPVPWGNLAWRALRPWKPATLDPDIIFTGGVQNVFDYYQDPALDFPHAQVQYVLYGRIVSPDDRTVRAVFPRQCVRWLSLNGRRVEGTTLSLKQGSNDLRLLYAATIGAVWPVSENNYGCYFRLTDADGNRVEDVRFERPPAP
ncbi:MAG: hypothetical protein PHE83_14640 [Opitutaceae bacterium]|nr:hypothetical protein [Opitutaceae bacterium]